MGNGATKEEQLYQAVQNGNHNAVKALRRDGAALEFVDKEGRTPLTLACMRGDLYETAFTLLQLGANIRAYQPGTHGGVPLHQAAKFGLDKTVLLLLSRGADPLAMNDDVLTPLDLARNRGHVNIVRMIEERIGLFTGMVREMAGLGFIEAFAPQWVTKKVWVVVVPTESDPRKPPRLELVIYQSQKLSVPRTIVSLAKADVEEPKFSSPDPVLHVTDKVTKNKYKFLSESVGDKVQLQRLYKACRGVPQTASAGGVPGVPSQAVMQGLSTLIRPVSQQESVASSSTSHGKKLKDPSEAPNDLALKMAMEASLRAAPPEGTSQSEHNKEGEDGKQKTTVNTKFGGWDNEDASSNFNGWSASSEAGPSKVEKFNSEPLVEEHHQHPQPAPKPIPVLNQDDEATTTTVSAPSVSISMSSSPPPPSAPPLPVGSDLIHYPSIDLSPVQIDYSAITPHEEPPASVPAPPPPAEEKGGQCVVCWDAPAQGVCIPCGHLAGCMDCLTEIKDKGWGCPVCRAAIQQVVKVYAV